MVIMYKIVCENGIECIKYYKTQEEAQDAADFRKYLSGKNWYVRAVVLK